MFLGQLLAFLFGHFFDATAALLTTPKVISGIQLQKVPLKRNNPGSPWCYTATVDPTTIACSSIKFNFLASQVWPSARVAAATLEKHVNKSWKVCEFGCGPALPSLTIAGAGVACVTATDLDQFALQIASAAAQEQGFDNFHTQTYDLVDGEKKGQTIPKADLYVMSDVFESSHVARGAARVTCRLLNYGARVWVFAQSDRSQREVYVDELRKLDIASSISLEWSAHFPCHNQELLWLCDIDENKVDYL